MLCNPSSRHSSLEDSMQDSSERHLHEEIDDTDVAHIIDWLHWCAIRVRMLSDPGSESSEQG